MKSKNRLFWLAGALAAAAVALVGIGNIARAQVEISDERARQIALERVPGTVVSLERDTEGGVRVVEVEVRDRQNQVFEIDIDARSGRIITVEAEDEEDEDDDDETDEDDEDDDADESAQGS
jgi:hypothetical protein